MNTPQHIYTIDNISQRRREMKEEVRRSKERMQALAQQLFAPQESKTRLESLMQHVNTGIAAYNGVRTGMKILQRIRGYFGRKKKS